ncbi:MAG: hypothetical protein AAFX87_23640 [Bacteroidota bacterium]
MTYKELESLTEDLRNGDNSGLKEIFETYSHYCITKLKFKTSCTHEDAEDIFIESVMNFREKAIQGKIKFLSSIKSYLFTTCYNMWSVQYQAQKNKQKKLSNVKDFLYEEYDHDILSAEEDDDNYRELLKIAQTSFDQLSEKCKDILSFFYIEKMRMEEIAGIVGLANASVVKTAKSRCFRKLMEFVKQAQGKDIKPK